LPQFSLASPSPGRAPPQGVGVRVLVALGAMASSSPGSWGPPLCNRRNGLVTVTGSEVTDCAKQLSYTCYEGLTNAKHVVLETSLTSIDKLAPSLYQSVETRSTEVF
jgi:hypothetical protein